MILATPVYVTSILEAPLSYMEEPPRKDEFIFDRPCAEDFAKLRPHLKSFVEVHQSDLGKQISYFCTIATIKEKNKILVGVEEPEKLIIREEFQGNLLNSFF